MNRRWVRLALASLFLLLPLAGQAQARLAPEQLTGLAGIVENEIAAGRIPGAVVLVGQGEHIIYAQAFGYRALVPDKEAMTLDTIFDMASLTKVVATTPAILQLVESGALALDDPVSRYWPEFAVHGKEKISIRQLLSHTSGLPAGIDLRGNPRPRAVRARLASIKPVARPGGDPIYSDVNFAVLGELVRRVSGQNLEFFVQHKVLAPLAMADTGFLPAAGRRQRIAPTTWSAGEPRRGQVHDPLAAQLGGVAGNAGLFGTAGDLARFARALLAGGAPILASSSVAGMWTPQTYPAAPPRGLGWRLDAPLASNRAALPPVGAASHLGYTGTGLWIDPVTGLYVVVLSNRIHLDGGGDAGPLRARVIAAVAEAAGPIASETIAARRPELVDRVLPYVPKTVATPVRTGIDVLEAQDFLPLRGLRFGLLTNRSGVDHTGRRSIDVLFQTSQLQLAAIFSPEHGLAANREGRITNDTDALTGLPIYSLYGPTQRPTPEMLDGLDALVVDLQDAGTRFYTYATTLAYVVEAAAERKLQVFVLDRPNPVNGTTVQGPVLDIDRRSFTGYWPLPVRHGLTLGEFARLFQAEAGIAVKLAVIPMQGYRRSQWYDETGLPWLPPSPNLTSLGAAILYPGVGLIEGAEISVGRGTATPFEVVGAPWIDGNRLASELERLGIPGVHFSPAEFEPMASVYAGEHCHGVRIEVINRDTLDTPALGLALAMKLYRLYPEHFSVDKILGNFGNRATLDAIRAGRELGEIIAEWQSSLAEFRVRRKPYLIYE